MRTFTESRSLSLGSIGFANQYDDADLVWRPANILERLDKTERDGSLTLTQWTEFEYDESGADATHLLLEKTTGGDNVPTLITEITRAHEEYNATGELEEWNILAPVIREDKAKDLGNDRRYLSSSVTTWKAFSLPLECSDLGVRWHPHKTYGWKASASSLTRPAFSSWDGGSPGSVWQLQSSKVNYDCEGNLTQQTDANGAVTTLDYGRSFKHAYLTDLDVEGLSWTMDYYPLRGRLKSITDPNTNQTRSYSYDEWRRIEQINGPGSQTLNKYMYYSARNSGNNWSYDADTEEPNYTVTETYSGHWNDPRFDTEYFDGRARSVQHHLRYGTYDYVTPTDYDEVGRKSRAWKTYRIFNADHEYRDNFAAEANAYFNGSNGPDANGRAYAEYLYEQDILGRLTDLIDPGVTSGAGEQKDYGLESINGETYSFVKSTDEVGDESLVYKDALGRTVRTNSILDASTSAITTFEYDLLGNLTKVIQPEGQERTYSYNTRSELIEKMSPNGGTTKYKYDPGGNVRFSQDAVQASNDEVYSTTYDDLGRPLTSGVYPLSYFEVGSFAALDPDNEGYPIEEDPTLSPSNWVWVRAYDTKPSTNEWDHPWDLFDSEITPLTLSNTNGRLAGQMRQANGVWQATLYSYDAGGRATTKHIFTEGTSGPNSQIDLVYDRQGKITERHVTVGSATFHYWYDYTGHRQNLHQVYASTTSTKPTNPEVGFSYNAEEQIATIEFDGIESRPYRYDARGRLVGINEDEGPPFILNEYFAARYSYYADDNVYRSRFFTNNPSDNRDEFRYTFSYDGMDRLVDANYGRWIGPGWYDGDPSQDVNGITYDLNGNLLTLKRRNDNGSLVDDLQFGYVSNMNRISNVSDNIGTTGAAWDVEDGGFSHDANGRILTTPEPNDILVDEYDERGLPLEMTTSLYTDIIYRYNAEGRRYLSHAGTGLHSDRWYHVLDGNAALGRFKETAPTTGNYGLEYWNIVLPSGEVMGRVLSGGARRYYLKDRLGSVRVVLDGSGNIKEARDYYPYGLRQPSRSYTSGEPANEDFTGHVWDYESRMLYAGARYYMPAFGRWMTTDPILKEKRPKALLDQDAHLLGMNPYNYAFDNPTNLTDPDGKQPCPPCFELYEFGSGFVSGLARGEGLRGAVQEGTERVIQGTKLRSSFLRGTNQQLASRFTWEIGQTITGYTTAEAGILTGNVERIDHGAGATLVTSDLLVDQGAFALGNSIFAETGTPVRTGSYLGRPGEGGSIFQHEYGHYLQSQLAGPTYFGAVAIPSFLSATQDALGLNLWDHSQFYMETDAHTRAERFFDSR